MMLFLKAEKCFLSPQSMKSSRSSVSECVCLCWQRRMCVHMYIYMCVCMCVCVCVYVCGCVCVCVCVCVCECECGKCQRAWTSMPLLNAESLLLNAGEYQDQVVSRMLTRLAHTHAHAHTLAPHTLVYWRLLGDLQCSLFSYHPTEGRWVRGCCDIAKESRSAL